MFSFGKGKSSESDDPIALLLRANEAEKTTMEADSLSSLKAVVELYVNALEAVFNAIRTESNAKVKEELKTLVTQNMDRAEKLKKRVKAIEERSVAKADTYNYTAGPFRSTPAPASAVSSLFTLPPYNDPTLFYSSCSPLRRRILAFAGLRGPRQSLPRKLPPAAIYRSAPLHPGRRRYPAAARPAPPPQSTRHKSCLICSTPPRYN